MINLKPRKSYQLKVDGSIVKTESGKVLIFEEKDLPLLHSIVERQIEMLHTEKCEIIEITRYIFIHE